MIRTQPRETASDGADPDPTAGRSRLPSAAEVLPWLTRRVSVRPFGPGWWSFNPSVHYDRATGIWRCVFRCANYSLPDGVPQLSPDARRGRAATRNAIAVLDPATLEIAGLREVRELDDLPRSNACTSLGFEDMRLFSTERDGLMAVATCLERNVERPSCPEMVLCWIDDAGDVVRVAPLRGSWSHRPQKNWSPFDGTATPRLLYSIERGVVMGEDGPVRGSPPPTPAARRPQGAQIANRGRSGVEIKIMTGYAVVASPAAAPPAPGSSELRGGSQLVAIGGDRWLGIAHEMKLRQPERKKYYWHTLYLCDGAGRLLARSAPLKLDGERGIEFAAGIAVDDRGGVAISYGTDDHDSWIAVTRLDAILGILRPVDRTTSSP